MGLMGRLRVVIVTFISISFVGLIFDQLGRDLIQRVESQNGPFSDLATQLETLVPLVLVFLLLSITVWFILSGVRRERVRDQRRVRRP